MRVRVRAVPPDEGGSKAPLWSGCRLRWLSDRTDLHEAATVILASEPLDAGRIAPALLVPVDPDRWEGRVQAGDRLFTEPHDRQVINAFVLSVDPE